MSRLKETGLLGIIIDRFNTHVGIFPPKNICEDLLFISIWRQLIATNLDKPVLINTCVRCIMTYIEHLELLNQWDSERYYRFFTALLIDLRPFVDTIIQKDDNRWY
ncbi:hypothetical protein RF11_07850 [Thelohanellus kitauei]|uniref:Uncharacterized protein n=1 Tax=Thelohanellus kitauei TaxID=669202 RepID=A0A0C2J169_THEKT|nr:hypothetical protein RF11_07850 [Thelohanellus kitauei]